MYNSGFSVEEIAEKRKLGLSTVMSHLAKLYIDGAPVDLTQFISNDEVRQIAAAKTKLENPVALKPYFDYFEERIDYGKIRLALAIIEKQGILIQ